MSNQGADREMAFFSGFIPCISYGILRLGEGVQDSKWADLRFWQAALLSVHLRFIGAPAGNVREIRSSEEERMTKVALVKGEDRKENVRQALELVGGDIDLKGRRPVIKVNFVSTYKPLSATHPDAVRPIVEFLSDRGEKNIAIAEGAAFGNTARGFQ